MEAPLMFRGAFAGAPVLVTGHTGFKGAWLALWLARLGARVMGLALDPPTTPNLFSRAAVDDIVEHHHGDIRDVALVQALLEQHQPAFVFHLAASTLVRKSYAAPIETFDNNVIGTVSVLEAVRRSGISAVVIIASTDKCYENREWDYGYRETDRLGGHDPYSASKAAMEIAVDSFRRSFFPTPAIASHGVRIATVRAGNVIGGGDWAVDRIVPDAVRAFARGEVLGVRNPRTVRPWQHVLEPLSGYLWLAALTAESNDGALCGAWNFGPGPEQNRTVAELADALVHEWREGSWREMREEDGPHEARTLRLSIEKAVAHLDWQLVWDFGTTVKQTVRWYQRCLQTPDDALVARTCCEEDIALYEEDARARGRAWAS